VNGEEALASIAKAPPDLVLLEHHDAGPQRLRGVSQDSREPGDRAAAGGAFATSLDPTQERVKGIEAGRRRLPLQAREPAGAFARVRSLLRVKGLQDERLARLKSFFSPQLAEAIAAGKGEELLKTHRREITVEFFDLRGFTAFTEAAEPRR